MGRGRPRKSGEINENIAPEIPPALAGMKTRALSEYAAEELGDDAELRIVDDNSNVIQSAHSRRFPKRNVSDEVLNPIPQIGMTVDQVQELMGRNYEEAPEMEPSLGDRTPAFMRWLAENHPRHFAIRFYTRIGSVQKWLRENNYTAVKVAAPKKTEEADTP